VTDTDGAPPKTMSKSRLAQVEHTIGYRFSDRRLLARAFTHPSLDSGPRGRADYERLEFLGDAVLGLIVADEIYTRLPELDEGTMTKLKASVVSHSALVATARRLGFAERIVLGPTHARDSERALPSALEDVYEALVAAIYLDGGLDAARRFVVESIGDSITPEGFDALTIEHPKSRLQEIAQARGTVPAYHTVAIDGPPHARTFTAEVTLFDRVLGRGTGRSKRDAETNAATAALDQLNTRG